VSEASPLSAALSAPADHEACAACGAPLGASARYCLSCGTRRAGSPSTFLDALGDPPEARPVAVSPVSLPQPDEPRLWSLALTAVVLLALLVGLLAGHWLGERDQRGTATQVTRTEGSAAAPPTAAPAGLGTGATR
jgi:hypothetical protein